MRPSYAARCARKVPSVTGLRQLAGAGDIPRELDLFVIIPNTMKLLRMKPGHGEIVLAEGDLGVPEEERLLIEAFRRELDAGMWAAVPTEVSGRREASMVKSFAEVPRDAERVIFFPRAAGGGSETGR